MGYRKYARDYKVEYVAREGHRRKQAVRTYVGPWFRFRESPARLAKLKKLYLIGLLVQLLLLLLPMVVNCAYTRLWYIGLPVMLCTIPMVFALGALWRLWTAKERVDREHSDLLGSRMASATFFLAGFSAVAFVGCVVALVRVPPAAADYLICVTEALAFGCGLLLFSRRKGLEMEQLEQK